MAGWPYSTPRWKRLRVAILREEPICRECRRRGQLTPASQVDHIRAIKDGGQPWDKSNLQALCASCHSRKTSSEDGGCWHPRRDRAVDPATGKPLAVGHWWNAVCEATAQKEKISQSCPPGTVVGIDARTKR